MTTTTLEPVRAILLISIRLCWCQWWWLVLLRRYHFRLWFAGAMLKVAGECGRQHPIWHPNYQRFRHHPDQLSIWFYPDSQSASRGPLQFCWFAAGLRFEWERLHLQSTGDVGYQHADCWHNLRESWRSHSFESLMVWTGEDIVCWRRCWMTTLQWRDFKSHTH